MTTETSINHEKHFDGLIRPLQEADITLLRPILESWIVDDNEVQEEEIEEILNNALESTQKNNDRNYIVAESSQGEILGIMGLAKPDPRMLIFTKTEQPVEVVNAFVNREKIKSGTGRALVASLEELACSNGNTELVVNSGPRYFYTGGWTFWNKVYGNAVGVAHDYYGPRISAKVWRKEL